MKRLRYQPGYWHYLMGNFIDSICVISVFGMPAGEPTGRFYQSGGKMFGRSAFPDY